MWWDSGSRQSSSKKTSGGSASGGRKGSKKSAAARRRKPASRPEGSSRTKVRILLADHQPIDRAGMIAMLQTQPDFVVVGEASSAEEAVRRCRELEPSVTVLALHLPTGEDATALAHIRAHVPNVPILAIAERGEGTCLVLNPPRSGRLAETSDVNGCSTGTDCLQLAVVQGATGTIRRSAEAEELFRALRTVASGKAWYEAGTATAIMRHALARPGDGARPSLSDRETEVAELIAAGRSNKEIAQALNISEPTVKKHVGHVLGKLKLQDRLQIGLYVARNPLILRREQARS
jgi:DNA-binding NarL/FixJ family response regulator